MTRVHQFPHPPAPSVLRAWQTWFTRHGIDPDTVLVGPGWVEVDDTARTVTWLAPHLPDGETRMHTRRRCNPATPHPNGPCTRAATLQLEAPALPFPEGPR